MATFIFSNVIENHTKFILKDYTEVTQNEKTKAEEYTKMITPQVNQRVSQILESDKEISNVLLLNYHNTISSTHGLSYLYLTTLTEKVRGLDTETCYNLWKELNYIYYGEEFEKIHNNNYLIVDSIPQITRNFPKLSKLLLISEAKSAAFYPIEGINQPIGMIVILYKITKKYDDNYYPQCISSNIQVLSSLLDYNSTKRKNND